MQTPIVPPANTAVPATANLPAGTGTAANLPPSLAQALQSGGALSAQVTARPQAGQLTLSVQTGQGGAPQTVQVQTPLPLPPGTNLAVTLQAIGSPTTLFLQPQSGAGAQTGAQAGGGAAASAAGGGAAAQPAVLTSLTQGSTLTATVTGPPTAGRVTSGGGAAAAQSAAQAGAQASAQGQAAGATGARVLPPGTSLQLQLMGLAPQGQALAGGSAGSFIGTVTGQTAGGGTSVSTPMGTVSMSVPNPPPAGTQLLLNMIGDPRAPAPGSGTDNSARFQALQQAVSLLRGGDPAAAQRLTQSLMPQPNAQFGLAALFLVQSLRQGGVERWLGGDTARALSAAEGGKGLLSKLDGDLRSGLQPARDGAGQDWRVTTLPLMNDGQIDQIRLYTRNADKDGESDKDGRAEEARRFVIEANFTRLGPLQLDGLAREKTVDLMVRTQRPLDEEARDGIRALFADTVSALGFAGQVAFRVVPGFDLRPTEAPDGPGAGGLTV
jgi:hypothetical protein